MSEMMERDLDMLLAELADDPALPEMGGLMARILADADREQPRAPEPSRPRVGIVGPQTGGGGWFGGLAQVVGGRGALAGMMLATAAGLYVGLAQPATLGSLTSLYAADTPLVSLDLMSGSDSLWTETAQ